MTVLPGSLSPGDLIWSPGGEARVLTVEPVGPLVRLGFVDRTSEAFVYLRRGTPVVRVGQTPGTRPTVSVHPEASSATGVPEEPTMPDYEPAPRTTLQPLNLTPEALPCDACGAEPGEPCNVGCIGEAAHQEQANTDPKGWYEA